MMRLLRTITVCLVCFAAADQTFAYGLYSMWPSYNYGYGGYYAYSPVYAYPSYGGWGTSYSTGYRGSYGCSSCCQTSCGGCQTCGGSCQSSCGGSCGTSCGGSCGTSCGGSCGTGCQPESVRKQAIPDAGFEDKREDTQRRQDDDRRFQGGSGAYDGESGGRQDEEPRDGFGRESGAGGANPDAGIWNPSGGTGAGESTFDANEPIPGFDGLGSSRKPAEPGAAAGPMDPGGAGGTGSGAGTEEGAGPVFDRTTRKPPVNLPVDESGATEGELNDEATDAAADGAPSPADGEADPGAETSPEEFLPPDDGTARTFRAGSFLSQRDSRSSHFGVVAPERLLTGKSAQRTVAKTISASQPKPTPVQWISVPAPAGRIRL